MKIVKSQIVPIQRKDIDTDLIIPSDYLKVTTRDGLGKHLFEELCELEKDFPLNLKKYEGAQILVVDENFGCGSSREHAPWAIKDWGFKAVVAPSFADIFHSNAFKNGILLIKLDGEIIQKIFNEERGADLYEVKIDLPNQKIILPSGDEYEFDIDPFKKECLIKEMDDLDYLLSHMNDIENFTN